MRNRSVLVTGASSGIGRALAHLLGARGARVGLVGRRQDALEDVAREIRAAGGRALVLPADAALRDEVQATVARAVSELGGVDALVHSAGRGLRAALVDIRPEDWEATISINYTAAYLWSREVARHMIATGRQGDIQLVSSMAGLVNVPGYSAYCSSKHALTSFARCIAPELRRHGIRVSLLHPYKVDTPFFDAYAERPAAWQMLPADAVAQHALAVLERRPLDAAGLRLANLGRRMARAARLR